MLRTTLESMFRLLAASENFQLKVGHSVSIGYGDAILSAHDAHSIKQSAHVLKFKDEEKIEIIQAIDEEKSGRPVGINLQNLAEDLGRNGWHLATTAAFRKIPFLLLLRLNST